MTVIAVDPYAGDVHPAGCGCPDCIDDEDDTWWDEEEDLW